MHFYDYDDITMPEHFSTSTGIQILSSSIPGPVGIIIVYRLKMILEYSIPLATMPTDFSVPANPTGLSLPPIGGLTLESAGAAQACVTYESLPVTETVINLSTRGTMSAVGERTYAINVYYLMYYIACNPPQIVSIMLSDQYLG